MQKVEWSNLNNAERGQILTRQTAPNIVNVTDIVSEIIKMVQQNGDQALIEYALSLDKVKLTNLKVMDNEYAVTANLDSKYKAAIIQAAANIEDFHRKSKPVDFEYANTGINLGKIYRPIERVGLYIPGGTAALVSTLMMLVIPAKVAGCAVKAVVTPARADGTIAPAILFAAKHCGIDTIYKSGGAQAIAALAFGTETIPKVSKIFGPGNKYVTEAKIQVSSCNGGAAIDLPAGPSEVLVIAEANANPEFVASDLLAQAEHDAEAQVILVTTSARLAESVVKAVSLQLNGLSRKDIIEKSLNKSAIILATSLDECFVISNQYAPEHLILHIDKAKDYLTKIVNAGSVFIGQWSPESVGDYASGTNHVLPTYGYAKMYSGLDVMAFMKSISFQELSAAGLQHISSTVTNLATLEGLDAHKNAVTIRLQSLNKLGK